MTESRADRLIEHLFRHESGMIVSRLASTFGFADIGVIEDAVQESLIAALRAWPIRGVPGNPAGWLYTVARNRAIDTVRRRIHRAKAKLQTLTNDELVEISDIETRRRRVIATLYLLFNEGYSSHSIPGSLNRDFLEEAVDLIEELCDDPELVSADAHALAALMYFHGARVPARMALFSQFDSTHAHDCAFIPYDRQDRSQWNGTWIRRGMKHFKHSMQFRNSRYHIEAAIAACYCDATVEPDWNLILTFYDQLLEIAPSPYIDMNRSYTQRSTEPRVASSYYSNRIMRTACPNIYSIMRRWRISTESSATFQVPKRRCYVHCSSQISTENGR
jgi:predicted RNA polymerase sigma factor